jgi:hypothetical protein
MAVEMAAEKSPGIHRQEWRWALTWACVVVAVTCLPYLYAWLAAPEGLVFGGLLTNPLDGNSYLAKMRQGFQGEWCFHLPFTPEPHDGAFIFTYYLALGHLARLLGLSLPLVFHLARAVNGLLLLVVIYWFFARLESERWIRRTAFLLAALSSGLGWLVALFGLFTVDLWVPEATAFYSVLANPHFPLAMALMLVVIGLVVQSVHQMRLALGGIAGASLLLAVVQPFAIFGVFAVLGGFLIVQTAHERRVPWPLVRRTLAGGLAATPILAYDAWVYATNPAFAAWSAQNLTPSPPLWDYGLSYGLVLILALVGLPGGIRRGAVSDRLAAIWIAVIAALLYAPFPLQRRLVMGLHFPLCFLAAQGLRWLVDRWPARRRLLTGTIIGLGTFTNLFLLLGAVVAVRTGDARLFLYHDEVPALAWLRDHALTEALVLAAPQTGLLIPAWAGQRVIYGHPFETIQADERESLTRDFFTSSAHLEQLLTSFEVDYVFFGPRERALGDWVGETNWPVAYQNDGVTIFAIR